MGRRKGYQQPLTQYQEMSQVNDYVFSTTEGAPSYQRSIPFFFKNNGSSVSQASSSSDGKVIGASYSHFDRPSRSRTSMSPERTSIGSVNSMSPRLKVSKAKKLSVFDDDDDWDDGIDDEFLTKKVAPLGKLYPDLEYVEPTEPIAPTHPVRPTSAVRSDYKDIINDPFRVLEGLPMQDYRHLKLVETLTQQKESIDLTDLKKQAWKGLPIELRGLVWQLLLGYIPTNSARRQAVLQRKRKEYQDTIEQIFNQDKDQIIWHQIIIDVPRTNPTMKLYSYPVIQRLLERLLYIWAVRHPASGYVQGINDLATPILQVFLQSYLDPECKVATQLDPEKLDVELLEVVEADTFWCLTKILDTIQDNYIHEQPGIMRQVESLANLTLRIDEKLYQHIKEQHLEFLQFSFRWMNCMLMRELRIDLIIRMWDTYISEFPKGFNEFHVYVCCAFLMKFSEDLKEMEFQEMIMFLQDQSKTDAWSENEVEMLLSEAYIWQTLYKNATAHLK